VVTRHTIEHVPNPVAFLSGIREALGPEAKTTIFVETPCIEWILGNEAMQDLQAAIDSDPELVDAYVLKARIHLLRQEINKGGESLDLARAKLQAMVDAGERDPEIKKKLSEVIIMRSVSRQDVDDRIDDLLKAIEADPENEKAIQLTVESLASVGRLAEAEATIRKFLEADPSNEYALRRLVIMMVQSEKIDQAETLLSERILKQPESSLLHALRASVWLTKASQGNPSPEERTNWLESAKKDSDKAIELDEENLDAYLNRTRICLALKDYEQAKDLLLKHGSVKKAIEAAGNGH
jgi:tetratricopeptide (TPR) repeat protein